MTTQEIIKRYNLTPDQADEIGNKAAVETDERCEPASFQYWEDHCNIFNEEDIDLLTYAGNAFTSIEALENKAWDLYCEKFEELAQLI